jgi:divalent metal cation (Fe/Co/Zn/Cd) transporter
MAFAVAGYILSVSVQQVRHALAELSDAQLPDEEIQAIRKVLDTFRDRAIEAHDLRTRKSGAMRHVDFHLVLCGNMTVNRSHSVCDEIELALQALYPNVSVNIHVEPCESQKAGCEALCEIPAAVKLGASGKDKKESSSL